MTFWGKIRHELDRWRMSARPPIDGQCLSCHRMLPEDHPADAEQTCSEECANEVLESHQW